MRKKVVVNMQVTGFFIVNFIYSGENWNMFTKCIVTKRIAFTACRTIKFSITLVKSPYWIVHPFMKPLDLT